jgi:hypothetical protein
VAVGLVSSLLFLADGVLSPLFQVTLYMMYFKHVILAILVAYVLTNLYSELSVRIRIVYWLPYIGAMLLLVYGTLVAHGTYRRHFPNNKTQNELAQFVNVLDLNEIDLVIAPAIYNDDVASWMPLVTRAPVLLSREGEFVLPQADSHRIQRYRRALSLFLSGKNVDWVEQVISTRNESGLYLLADIGQAYLLDFSGPESEKNLAALRDEFVPLMSRLENGDPATVQFFRNFHRVLVINEVQKPMFIRARLSKYLILVEEKQIGSYTLLWCKPL